MHVAADGDPAFTGGDRSRPLGDGPVTEVGRLLGMAGRFQHLRQPGK